MRIGVLSDTHLPATIAEVSDLGGRTLEVFADVDLIMHAGDVVLPRVLDWCEQFAPVVCSLGGQGPLHRPALRPRAGRRARRVAGRHGA